MGVTRVLLIKGLKDTNVAQYFLTFHERITSQFSNRQSKAWHILTKLFRDKNAATGIPKLIHSLVFSNDVGKVYCLADDVMIEAEHELETILSKLKNLWSVKQDVKFEGYSYNIGDFIVRTVDARHKGMLVEVEYLPTTHPHAASSILSDFIDLIMPKDADIVRWDEKGDNSYTKVGLSEETFTRIHTAYQYMTLFKSESLL
ncbi:mediator complex, subunit Med20 [Gigaspora rosea]|uniref:Mediator of RNA polymerase II transcription subunit 20 n=1 Tax=Gigaspora rosea TaxID=44941 RepID=A0A397VR95_9GLOM|nr:mediator complex, subunit Med20 [Gigaspora rosea]